MGHAKVTNNIMQFDKLPSILYVVAVSVTLHWRAQLSSRYAKTTTPRTALTL
jgi:hypothetical protein